MPIAVMTNARKLLSAPYTNGPKTKGKLAADILHTENLLCITDKP